MTPWVHIDSGSVRYWPRMNRDALARLFPDGKTVFIPADGQPMAGYEQARAEIEARGGEVMTASNQRGGGLFGWLFGARGGGARRRRRGRRRGRRRAAAARAGATACKWPARARSARRRAPQCAARAETSCGAGNRPRRIATIAQRGALLPERPAWRRSRASDIAPAGRAAPARPAEAARRADGATRRGGARDGQGADADRCRCAGPIAAKFIAPVAAAQAVGLDGSDRRGGAAAGRRGRTNSRRLRQSRGRPPRPGATSTRI